jgi:hypothetical protein
LKTKHLFASNVPPPWCAHAVEVQRLSTNNQPIFLLEESLCMDHLEDTEEIEDPNQIMTIAGTKTRMDIYAPYVRGSVLVTPRLFRTPPMV